MFGSAARKAAKAADLAARAELSAQVEQIKADRAARRTNMTPEQIEASETRTEIFLLENSKYAPVAPNTIFNW